MQSESIRKDFAKLVKKNDLCKGDMRLELQISRIVKAGT